MLDVSFWSAFVGGLVVFFSPCILPIVPFYLSYMAGTGINVLSDDGELPRGIQSKAVLSSVMFSLGIITVFVLLGAAAFSISQSFRTYQDEFRIRRGCDYPNDWFAFPWRDPHRIFEPSISGAGRGYKQHVRDGVLCCWACLCCGMDALCWRCFDGRCHDRIV